MAEITNPAKVKIGHWHTFCCAEDLRQIETKAQLTDARACLGSSCNVWETEEEARKDIASWDVRSPSASSSADSATSAVKGVSQ